MPRAPVRATAVARVSEPPRESGPASLAPAPMPAPRFVPIPSSPKRDGMISLRDVRANRALNPRLHDWDRFDDHAKQAIAYAEKIGRADLVKLAADAEEKLSDVLLALDEFWDRAGSKEDRSPKASVT
jgi:hypothetical protein